MSLEIRKVTINPIKLGTVHKWIDKGQTLFCLGVEALWTARGLGQPHSNNFHKMTLVKYKYKALWYVYVENEDKKENGGWSSTTVHSIYGLHVLAGHWVELLLIFNNGLNSLLLSSYRKYHAITPKGWVT